MMKGGIGNLMRQAQQMQENMQKAQAELSNLEVTGESGAGMVKVVLNGRHEAKKVTIEPKLVTEELEMLEDLVAAAINDASRKIEERSKEKYADLMSGMNLPPGMKLPFKLNEVHAHARAPDRCPALPARCRSQIRPAHGFLSPRAR